MPHVCSGCPHCNADLATMLADFGARRFAAISRALAAQTQRVVRFLNVGPKHPLGTVPSPPLDALANALRKGADTSLIDRMRESHSPIGPAPRYAPSTPTNPPPSLADALKEKK